MAMAIKEKGKPINHQLIFVYTMHAMHFYCPMIYIHSLINKREIVKPRSRRFDLSCWLVQIIVSKG